jgi:hypothetical protein
VEEFDRGIYRRVPKLRAEAVCRSRVPKKKPPGAAHPEPACSSSWVWQGVGKYHWIVGIF